jgi:hypothetical protein
MRIGLKRDIDRSPLVAVLPDNDGRASEFQRQDPGLGFVARILTDIAC